MRYNLNLAANYVTEWSLWEALRELAQNYQDQKEASGSDADTITYDAEPQTLRMVNHTTLPVDVLIMGQSAKGNDARGKFGEGLKLALLVLHRLGKPVTIQNGGQRWTTLLDVCPGFATPTLHVDVEEIDADDVLSVEIGGITPDDYTMLTSRLLFLRSDYGRWDLKSGEILTSQECVNSVYIKGIYVCPTSEPSGYGYNFYYCDTSRDRGFVDPWMLRLKAHGLISEFVFVSLQDGGVDEGMLSGMFAAIGETGSLEEQAIHHYGSYSSASDKTKFAELMTTQFVSIYGPDAWPIRNGDAQAYRTVKASGLIPIEVSSGMLQALSAKFKISDLESSTDVVDTEDDLTDQELSIFGWLRSMIPTIARVVRFKGVNVHRNGNDIARKALADRRVALEQLGKNELIAIILGESATPPAVQEQDDDIAF